MEQKNEIEREDGELVTFHGNEAELLASYDVTGEMLKKLKAKGNRLLKKDVSDKENYVLVNQGIKEVRDIRLKVEERRKELKADALKWGKMVDGEASRITEALKAIENPLKQLKSEQDEKEKARKEKAAKIEKERIDGIKKQITDIEGTYMACDGKDVEYVNEVIGNLKAIVVDAATFGEFIEDAQTAITDQLDRLAVHLENKVKAQEQEAELAIQRAEQEAKQAELDKEREEFEEYKREKQAKLDAEARAQQEKADAEAKAKADADAEKKRKAEQAQQAKRDRAEQKKAFNSLKKFCSDDTQAGDILEAVIAGKVKNIRYFVDVSAK